MIDLHPVIMEDMADILSASVNWEKLRGSRVLITGANGLIGSYLIFFLLYLNDTRQIDITVTGLVRSRENARTRFGEALLKRSDFSLQVQDVCAPVDHMEEGVDYLIHTASQASPRHFMNDPVGTIRSNTLGTMQMLELARKKPASTFVFLSTREIYGEPLTDKKFVSEHEYGITDPSLVRSCYPESKRMAETICAAYRHQYQVNCKVARIAHTYGPGMTTGDGRVFGDFVQNILSGQNITLKSEGKTVLALTYLSDIICGILQLMLDMDLSTANLSSMEDIVSVAELAELFAELYREKGISVQYDLQDSAAQGYLAHRVALLDSTTAGALGWRAEKRLREGIQRTVSYFESLGK